MPFTTYILFSAIANHFYIGQSGNFEKRLKEHLDGKCKSTCHVSDWICVFTQEFEARAEAAFLERIIKGRGAKRFLDDLEKRGAVG